MLVQTGENKSFRRPSRGTKPDVKCNNKPDETWPEQALYFVT